MRSLTLGCAVLFLAAGIRPAGAATILYNNGAPDQNSADDITDTLVAEDFILGGPANLTSFEFWNVQGVAGDYNGSINWFIYNNGPGTPGATILAQGSAATGGQITRTSTANTCCGGFNEFDNVINMAASLTSGSLNLAAGTFWLAIHDGDISNTTFLDFYWETSASNATTPGQAQDLTAGPGWSSTLQEHAFNISGDSLGVPEPATWLFMAAGLGALALVRRRKA